MSIKERAKNFWNKNKEKIISVLFFAFKGILVWDDVNKRIENARLRNRIREEEYLINDMTKNNECLVRQTKKQSERIAELEEECETKDKNYNKMMSEALRHKSSYGGSQMRHRRDCLKKMQ